MSDASRDLRVRIGIVCRAGSAATGFITESKQIFHSKCKSSIHYHSEINCVAFRNWFEEKFQTYLAPLSVIVTDSESICWVALDKIFFTNTSCCSW